MRPIVKDLFVPRTGSVVVQWGLVGPSPIDWGVWLPSQVCVPRYSWCPPG